MNAHFPLRDTQHLRAGSTRTPPLAWVRSAACRAARHQSSSATCTAPVGQAADEQQPYSNDVRHLEQAYLQPSAATSLQPGVHHQQQQPAATTPPASAAVAGVLAGTATHSAAAAAVDDNWRSRLRGAYIRNVLPLFRTVRKTEKKLDADLPAVHYAIILMFAVILYDRGWNNLMDRFDESALGDVCSIMVGLGLVLGVKLMGWQPKDYFNV